MAEEEADKGEIKPKEEGGGVGEGDREDTTITPTVEEDTITTMVEEGTITTTGGEDITITTTPVEEDILTTATTITIRQGCLTGAIREITTTITVIIMQDGD
jgi:hypothetical protein